MNELIEITDYIKNLVVFEVEVVCAVLCEPEAYFECIEICKICGKLQ